ncbi:heme ABC transporter ATP-binding protein [uncultured Shewanella sp.]|uniref:heme ABC transporter ATP-binding protein n=1 Tax=uncultured Shewanella sp. TaxID=173975 RepID=UPI00262AA589|nr:heme ABC transporter ATP-binding protein [uncultured Shewanella sp.]
MLSISKLTLKVNQKTILNNINFNASAGKVIGIIGPNGAGKSSLLKAISQDLVINKGKIHFYHQELIQWPKQKLATLLGVLPQESSLSFPFKVLDVVEMGLYPLSISRQQGQIVIDDLLEKLAISHLKNRPYPSLSGGEKQRVHLARVLTQLSQAQKPPLLLLDEPTSALDLAQQHKVLGLVQSLAKQSQYTVITVLHDLNLASRYADELLIMKQGEIVQKGSPEQCLTRQNINDIWHYNPSILTSGPHTNPIII